MDGWGGEYCATAGAEYPKDMDLDGGGWDSSDQVDNVIGDDPVDRVTTFTSSTAAIDAVPAADLHVQPIEETKAEVVRGFLCEAGVPGGLLTGGWDELRGVIRGSLNHGRY